MINYQYISASFQEYCRQRGTQAELARQCHVTPQAITKWQKRVPAERVLQIEKATQGAVSRHDLRPDLYPIEDSAA